MVSEMANLLLKNKLSLQLERHAFSDFGAALTAALQPQRERKVLLMLEK